MQVIKKLAGHERPVVRASNHFSELIVNSQKRHFFLIVAANNFDDSVARRLINIFDNFLSIVEHELCEVVYSRLGLHRRFLLELINGNQLFCHEVCSEYCHIKYENFMAERVVWQHIWGVVLSRFRFEVLTYRKQAACSEEFEGLSINGRMMILHQYSEHCEDKGYLRWANRCTVHNFSCYEERYESPH